MPWTVPRTCWPALRAWASRPPSPACSRRSTACSRPSLRPSRRPRRRPRGTATRSRRRSRNRRRPRTRTLRGRQRSRQGSRRRRRRLRCACGRRTWRACCAPATSCSAWRPGRGRSRKTRARSGAKPTSWRAPGRGCSLIAPPNCTGSPPSPGSESSAACSSGSTGGSAKPPAAPAACCSISSATRPPSDESARSCTATSGRRARPARRARLRALGTWSAPWREPKASRCASAPWASTLRPIATSCRRCAIRCCTCCATR